VRWIILVLAMLMLSGCASAADALRDQAYRFKTWLSRQSDGDTSLYKNDETPETRAHHEQTVINELNNWAAQLR
jgi:hypothetical protein